MSTDADQAAPSAVSTISDLRFAYPDGGFRLAVEDLVIHRGETVACIGPSGCGKTTLVNLMTGILPPQSGRITLGGEEVTGLDDAGRRALRLARVGMVFQQFELLDYLTALQNILLPYHLSRQLPDREHARERAMRLARATGVEHVLARRPQRLSQGERQRVAICRALVTEPDLVMCDEPTGNLDPRTAGRIVDLLFEQVAVQGSTLFMVTHDHGLLPRFGREVDMRQWLDLKDEEAA